MVRAGLAISLVPREVAEIYAAGLRPDASFRWPSPGPSAASSSAFATRRRFRRRRNCWSIISPAAPSMTHPTTLALGPHPRILFLSDRSAGPASPVGRRATHARPGGHAARRRVHRRDHARAHHVALRRPAGTVSVHRFQGGRRNADRRRRRAGRRLRGDGRGCGATARAPRANTARPPKSSPASGWSSRESFERIYRQNADNIGLFTSTDLRPGRAHRSAARRSPLDELLAGRDALAAGILRAGGLLRFGQAASARGACRRPPAAGARPAHPVREDHRAPSAGHAGHRRPTRSPAKAPSCARTGASSTSTTPAWPRTCCTARFGRPLALHEPQSHRGVRGPHLLRGPEPRAPARRPRAEHARHVPGPARLRGATTACACTAR